MLAFTLYGFLTDDALYQSSKIDTDQSTSTHGTLVGEAKNYLYKKGILNDDRRSRLQILSNSKRPFGKMCLHFDQNRVDMDILKGVSDIDYTRIFNIIERLTYQQQFTDSNIEYQLVNDVAYAGYVPNTFAHSTAENNINITDENKEQLESGIRDWYSFDYTSEGVTFKIHFWVNRLAFAADYPYTTITAIIPPYDPTMLISTSTMVQESNLDVLSDSSSFIFSQSNQELLARDQNGIYTYRTKYVIDSNRFIQLPFALTYCGAQIPSSLECRKAIREYLEASVSIPQTELQVLFPELYVGSRFYIVPLWNDATKLSDRVVYPSVHNFKRLEEVSKHVFANYEEPYIQEHMELLLNAQNKMWALTLPDVLNDQVFSIYKEHPTYQDYSSQVPGFRYMEASTQEFAATLSRCMAVLNGELVSEEFITTYINGRVYLAFVCGRAEFLVLSKDSYLEAYGEV